jgi:hypothetical protein
MKDLPNREAYQRMNFLLQASQLMAAASEPGAAGSVPASVGENAGESAEKVSASIGLGGCSRFYAATMQSVSRKLVLRM